MTDEQMNYHFGSYQIEVKYVKKPQWVTGDWRAIGPYITGLRAARGEIARIRAMNPNREYRLVLMEKVVTYNRTVVE